MTYKDIIDMLEESAHANPDINTVHYGDIYYLNKQHNLQYPVFLIVPRPHNYINPRLNQFNLTLVYVDRLTEDRYKKDIQSIAISTIKDVVNRFRSYNSRYDDLPYSVTQNVINVYTDPQRFVDALTGAYIDIEIQADDETGNCYLE